MSRVLAAAKSGPGPAAVSGAAPHCQGVTSNTLGMSAVKQEVAGGPAAAAAALTGCPSNLTGAAMQQQPAMQGVLLSAGAAVQAQTGAVGENSSQKATPVSAAEFADTDMIDLTADDEECAVPGLDQGADRRSKGCQQQHRM